MIYEAGLIQVAIVSEVEMWISQAEGAGVAGGVDASEEERGNLGAQLQVVQRLPRPGVLRPEQQICKAPALRRRRLHVVQYPPHKALHAWICRHALPHARPARLDHGTSACESFDHGMEWAAISTEGV